MSDTSRGTDVDFEFISYLLSLRIIVIADTFFLQMAIKVFSQRQFCLLKFMSTVHIFIAVNTRLEDEITAWEMPLCLLKFVNSIFSQTLNPRVERCVQELQLI